MHDYFGKLLAGLLTWYATIRRLGASAEADLQQEQRHPQSPCASSN